MARDLSGQISEMGGSRRVRCGGRPSLVSEEVSNRWGNPRLLRINLHAPTHKPKYQRNEYKNASIQCERPCNRSHTQHTSPTFRVQRGLGSIEGSAAWAASQAHRGGTSPTPRDSK